MAVALLNAEGVRFPGLIGRTDFVSVKCRPVSGSQTAGGLLTSCYSWLRFIDLAMLARSGRYLSRSPARHSPDSTLWSDELSSRFRIHGGESAADLTGEAVHSVKRFVSGMDPV